MQDGLIGEIRCYAGNFAPKYWAYCQGQTLTINQNQALFAILGTVYGGNGTSTFQLPDLRGRIPIGSGTSQSLGMSFNLGQKGGEENHTLILSEIPLHSHTTTITQSTGNPAVNITINGSSLTGNATSPAGALSCSDDGGGSIAFFAPGNSAAVTMAPNSISLSNLVAGIPTVTIGTTGGSQPHSNVQPVLGMNYIICLQGVFPSRN